MKLKIVQLMPPSSIVLPNKDGVFVPLVSGFPEVIVDPELAREPGKWFGVADEELARAIRMNHDRNLERRTERIRNDRAAMNFAYWVDRPYDRHAWNPGAHQAVDPVRDAILRNIQVVPGLGDDWFMRAE